MDLFLSNSVSDQLLKEKVSDLIFSVSRRLRPLAEARTELVLPQMQKVLRVFCEERLGTQHFTSGTGYAHGDRGREKIDRIFAKVLGAEKAAVRLQFVSGTHAIASALFGVLRPGDYLLSVTGKPYETLEEVIGLRSSHQGSLADFGIQFKDIPFPNESGFDFIELEKALDEQPRMVFIQRSCGYAWRPSVSIDQIQEICARVHKRQPECICFVDNCYGEFVEAKEPSEVGADLIAGSLIKNPGGTIVPTGGYVAGRADLVEKACCRLTSPGIGSQGGTSFDLNRIVLQGLFLAPQMVSEALIGADLISAVFKELDFPVLPAPGDKRGDVIQAICLGNPDALKIVCKAFQKCSPVGSYLDPIPAEMAGYSNNLVMAGGTFIDGSTSEFSADAPLRAPYNLFVQGGTHRSHIKIALIQAIFDLNKAGLVDLPQNT